MGHQIRTTVENAQLFGQAAQRMTEVAGLYRVNEEVHRHLNVDKVPQALVEGLNNAAKHANTNHVSIRTRCAAHATANSGKEPTKAELHISDDGRGFDLGVLSPDHLRLCIMRERAQAIGATLAIESQARRGTSISLVWRENG